MEKRTKIIIFILSFLILGNIILIVATNKTFDKKKEEFLSLRQLERHMESVASEKVQKEYPEYLIGTNDYLISLMLDYEHYRKDININDINEDFYEESLLELENIIELHDDVLKNIVENEPLDDNLIYKEIYDELVQAHMFYSQSQIMKYEYYMSGDEETLSNGEILSNIVGNMIITFNRRINELGNTSIEHIYSDDQNAPILNPLTGDTEKEQ